MSQAAFIPPSTGYASIMVPMEPGPDAENRLKLAVSLADRFSSRLIGAAAYPLAAPLYFESALPNIASAMELQERQAAAETAAAEAIFRRVIGTRNQAEWRQAQEFPAVFALKQSRAADLVVATLPGTDDRTFHPMRADAADLVMDAGRPVLLAPSRADYLLAKRIVIGWKDTREARRAVADALPLLRAAEEVFVACVGSDGRGANDVCTYLGWHGVEASYVARPAATNSAAAELAHIAAQNAADLIVCGAYGHSRTREWMFGGVTRELLEHSRLCCLMAH